MSDWRDIETAPKDGSYIIACANMYGKKEYPYFMEVVSWNGSDWSTDGYPIYLPTHWMPLPKPPEEAK